MLSFDFNNVNESYRGLMSAIIEKGKKISPRGLDTLELSPVSITIHNPLENIIYSDSRRLNYGFMLGELAWILQKSDDMNHICWYNKNWAAFSDDGKTLNGAYGKRIFAYGENRVNQFESVYNLLKEDKNSRQGTIVLFDPNLDFKKTKDKPCTNMIRFSVREEKLNMLVVMRSNDIMFGYPYDVFNFTSLQEIMAGKLNIEVGTYTHVVDSLHMYLEQKDWCKSIIKENDSSTYDKCHIFSRPTSVEDIQTFINIEQTTRKMTDMVDFNHIKEMLDDISSPYWKSNAAFIALYNYRKMKRSDEFLNQLHPYITNELIYILHNYKALA